ncbi:N-6 DNA methylase [Pseudoalteromonas sp. 5Ae-yellow]|uniref:N-6 DNA methylase n=1 Tax=Pseudoalteromonas sp. 5Ae-yellow TaxID=2759847 RepID=UPI0015F62BD1|nr:N-6 DNA methylase [Pseudoalteromonas sp. 5Ae-yellow]MBA6408861.1 N-6 DNA methylase [Pseudoalteromonas sp. 5Ae-yellow]
MHLNQYYTQNIYGDALIQSLSISSPKIALDLGFGAGDLLHAARRRWKDLSLIGVDIDRQNIIRANSGKLIKTLELNGFELALPQLIREQFGNIDLLISNPPYFSCDLNDTNKRILHDIGLLDCISKKLNKIPAELIFLAQNLRLLSKSGELGIILPAGLISGQKWQPVREFLLSNYQITNVIQLPVESFKKTDAQTFILILKHRQSQNSLGCVRLSNMSEASFLNISRSQAISRADYNYYKTAKSLINVEKPTTKSFEIFRGNKSHNVLSLSNCEHVHTTNMPPVPERINLFGKKIEGEKVATTGDILIARVGRRCIGRVAIVETGQAIVSDCIIVISPKNKFDSEVIWNIVSSFNFKSYLVNAALGVGAKYITYKIIMDYLMREYVPTK